MTKESIILKSETYKDVTYELCFNKYNDFHDRTIVFYNIEKTMQDEPFCDILTWAWSEKNKLFIIPVKELDDMLYKEHYALTQMLEWL